MKVIATKEGQKRTLICQLCQTEDVRFPTIKSRAIPGNCDTRHDQQGQSSETGMMVVLFLCHNGNHLSQYSLTNVTVTVEVTPVENVSSRSQTR